MQIITRQDGRLTSRVLMFTEYEKATIRQAGAIAAEAVVRMLRATGDFAVRSPLEGGRECALLMGIRNGAEDDLLSGIWLDQHVTDD